MEEAVPFSIVSTVKALSGALRSDAEHEAEISREREKLWFKESSAKNLRNRDFLSPNTVLTTLFAGGEVSLKYVLTCAFFIFCVMISSWPAPVTDALSCFSAWRFYAWLEAPCWIFQAFARLWITESLTQNCQNISPSSARRAPARLLTLVASTKHLNPAAEMV